MTALAGMAAKILLEIARRQVDLRHQFRADREDSRQFQLRLRHLGRCGQLFLVCRVMNNSLTL